MTHRDHLHVAALRVTAADPATVGFWLAKHRETEGLSAADLAAKLGTDARGLALVAVCAAPRSDAFAADTAAVAARCGVDPGVLANVLRQEQGFAAWSNPSPTRPATDAGWLIAAHDADQPPPGDDDDPAVR